MVSITAELDTLRVRLTRGERWAALRRSDLSVPWNQVRSIETVADPYRLVHGLRAPGLAVPWRTRIGTWRAKGRKIFAVTTRHTPGIRLELQGHDFAQVLLSLPAPDGLAEQLLARLDASRSPADRKSAGNPDQRTAGE
jgi:hypothetical protein